MHATPHSTKLQQEHRRRGKADLGVPALQGVGRSAAHVAQPAEVGDHKVDACQTHDDSDADGCGCGVVELDE